jgi:hypothetical protein
MSTNTRTSSRPSSEEMLTGACELGLLELAWEHFVNKPKFDYLFVIDAPKISSVHALPPYNIAHFGITGFLAAPDRPEKLKGKSRGQRNAHYESQAALYPLTLGLTEILARYIFDRRWSNGIPKLMMASQLNTISGIIEAVERGSSDEITQTLAHTAEKNPLNNLLAQYTADKDKSANTFIKKVTQNLEELLPAIYGAYTQTRQFFRYSEVLPFPKRPDEEQKTLFTHSYKIFNDILTEANSRAENTEDDELNLNKIIQIWDASIPHSDVEKSDDDGMESENARTLGEIEYINRRLHQQNIPVRLAFVTTTGRLFRSALLRFKKLRPNQTTPKVAYSTQNRFEKSRYTYSLLANPDSDISYLPILDPRALMTSPDFVNYANWQNDIGIEDNAREISAWLPAFFAGNLTQAGNLDSEKLFRTYEHLQTGTTKHSDKVIETDYFSDIQYESLGISWEKYIRIVSTAEGSERILRRTAFHDIKAQFVGNDSLQNLMGKRLDETMSQWLAIVGGNALQNTLNSSQHKKSKKLSAPKFRVVPPLILPAFSNQGSSLFELIQHLNTKGPQFQEGQFGWLENPTPEQFGISTDDPQKSEKTTYIQMLGQAVLFASLGNWDAAYRLSIQAYAFAEQFLAGEQERDQPQYISGREAAYFASVAARRIRTSWVSYDDRLEGKSWVEKFQKTVIDRERYIEHQPIRKDIHLARGELEKLAWSTFGLLYRKYQGIKLKTDLPLSIQAFDSIWTQFNDVYEWLTGDAFSELNDDNVFCCQYSKQAYKIAHTYLLRQMGGIGLHLELLLAPELYDGHENSFIEDCLTLLEEPLSNEYSECLPLSILEKGLIAAARKTLGKAPTKYSFENHDEQDCFGFDLWRIEKLKNLLTH